MSDPIPVLHLDEHLLAVDKPPGLLVHRTRAAADREALLQRVRDQLGRHLFPVHRLDRASSGVLLFALTSEAAAGLQRALAAEDALKEYLVLCRGSTPAELTSERPLDERPARTSFEKLAEASRCSPLRARLGTGRRHQIRRHLAHLAHHVIGDTRYGKGRINSFFRATYGLPRLFLHARRLSVVHPATGQRLEVAAPLAPDLAAFLGRLPDLPPGLLETL